MLHYQPQYDMRSGNVIAAEALARLVDVDGQLIYPDRFSDESLLALEKAAAKPGRKERVRTCR